MSTWKRDPQTATCNASGGDFFKRIPLFSDVLQDYFWMYENDGLRLLQLRFYPCSTIVPVDWPGPINDADCFAR